MGSLNRVQELSKKFLFETFSKRANSFAAPKYQLNPDSKEPSADDVELFEKTYGKDKYGSY